MIRELQAIEEGLLSKVASTVRRYGMFDQDVVAAVAYSGGKDSLAALILLKKLGYQVSAVTVDMGDSLFDGSRIIQQARSIGIEAVAINVRDASSFVQLSNEQREEANAHLAALDALTPGTISCAHCYNAKVLAIYGQMKAARQAVLAFGHHRDDALASFMKCYWTDLYYRSVTLPQGRAYQDQVMRDLMARHDSIELARLADLVQEGRAATDEPPVEYLFTNEVRIVRPLIKLDEADIIDFIADTGYTVESSGCTFKDRLPFGTFRNLVNHDLHRRTLENPDLKTKLCELLEEGLTAEGTLRYRPRNTRERDYPGFKPFVRKA